MFSEWFKMLSSESNPIRKPAALCVEPLEGRAMMSATAGLVGEERMSLNFTMPAQTRTLSPAVQAPTDSRATGAYMWSPATGAYMWAPADASSGLVGVGRDDPFFRPTSPTGNQIVVGVMQKV